MGLNMRNKAPYEDWITAVKDLLWNKNINYDDAADIYSFEKAYDEYDLTPADAVADYQNVRGRQPDHGQD
jgi:hypothetical protein